MGDQPKYPDGWMPPAAKSNPKAAAWWAQGQLRRAFSHLHATPQMIEEDLVVLLCSFTTDQLGYAIQHTVNVWPEIVEVGRFDKPVIGVIARRLIANNLTTIVWYLRGARGEGPVYLREKIRAFDPTKAALFDTPQGWEWFDGTAFIIAAGLCHLVGKGADFHYPVVPGAKKLAKMQLALPSNGR